MKILTESVNDVKILQENVNGQPSGNYFIQGVFLQADVKNRNGRFYPHQTCENAVARYNKDYIATGRSLGELGHPDNAGINLHLASHMITELNASGKDYIGKAKLLDTPMGNIAKSLVKEGVKLGVSLRGSAAITSKNGMDIVGENFVMTTVDIVADPSMPDAFVEGIMENTQSYIQTGALTESDMVYIQESVRKLPKVKLTDSEYLKILENVVKSKN